MRREKELDGITEMVSRDVKLAKKGDEYSIIEGKDCGKPGQETEIQRAARNFT